MLLVCMDFSVRSDELTSSTEVTGIPGKGYNTTKTTTETMTEEPIITSMFTRQQTLRGCTNSTANSVLFLTKKTQVWKYLLSFIATIFFV